VVVPPDGGHADYRTQLAVAPCVVGEAPTVAVAAADGDYTLGWDLRDGNGDSTTDFGAMRTAQVTVKFENALNHIDDWTSTTMTCSGAPDPSPEPTVSPTP
jgi:hypothetical protein